MQINVQKLMANFALNKIGGLFVFCSGIEFKETDFLNYVKRNIDCYFDLSHYYDYKDFKFNLKIRSVQCTTISFSPYTCNYKNCTYKCDYCNLKVSDFFAEIYNYIKQTGKFPVVTSDKNGQPTICKKK